jgi:hypothetical protein
VKLEWIKTTACPECGCTEVVAESIETDRVSHRPPILLRHTCGQTWEKREFLCGLVVSWVPNFNAERMYIPCSQTPEARERDRRRKELRDMIANLNRELSSI